MYCLSYSLRLFPIKLAAIPSLYMTKSAASCASVAEYHKCKSSCAPAFPNIRAARFLANCMKAEFFCQVFKVGVILAGRKLCFYPAWFSIITHIYIIISAPIIGTKIFPALSPFYWPMILIIKTAEKKDLSRN